MSLKSVLGAVLAGGASRRFGRDKATATVGDSTLLDRAAGVLASVSEEVVVVANEPGFWRWATIPDARPPCGPLGGIEAALKHATEEEQVAVLVLACDYPLVTAATLNALVAAIAHGATAACAAREGDPPYHPLCAAYSIGALPVASRLLDEGVRAAKELHRACEGSIVHVPAEDLLNVNEPADLEAVERTLRARADGRVAGRDAPGDLRE